MLTKLLKTPDLFVKETLTVFPAGTTFNHAKGEYWIQKVHDSNGHNYFFKVPLLEYNPFQGLSSMIMERRFEEEVEMCELNGRKVELVTEDDFNNY